jgi:transcriptional regulator NrdR family protein
MVKCLKCNGEFRVKSSYRRKDGTKFRHRKCDSCGLEYTTMEISAKEYDRLQKLLQGLRRIIQEYIDSKNKG